MWRMYCVCLLSVIVVLDLLGQSHVNRNSNILNHLQSIQSHLLPMSAQFSTCAICAITKRSELYWHAFAARVVERADMVWEQLESVLMRVRRVEAVELIRMVVRWWASCCCGRWPSWGTQNDNSVAKPYANVD